MSFYKSFAKILNSGQTRSVIVSGDIYDLFFNEETNDYVPLIELLKSKTKVPGLIRIVYELNGPIQVLENRVELLRAWKSHRQRDDSDKEFDKNILDSIGNNTLALEFLRQLTIASRKHLKDNNLFIIIEGGEIILPQGNFSNMNEQQIRRVSIIHDWFSDPEFCNGQDSVCVISETLHSMHSRVATMPQLINIEIPAPEADDRQRFIEWMFGKTKNSKPLVNDTGDIWDIRQLAEFTAGLSIHALRQLLINAYWNENVLSSKTLISKIEEYIQSQLGEDVIEFKKPTHTLKDVVGYPHLKKYLEDVFIPRVRAGSLSGAAVVGPLGAGKTFIFEAVAAMLGIPVLVLKNIRSQWYGQTDVIIEKLKRVLESLERVAIVVDEADTQFGSLGQEEHSTEKRLTGKIQGMMSDVSLRGKVIWLLMTARVHRLSADIRRPGRVGDLIIPILDPDENDAKEFSEWVLKSVTKYTAEELKEFTEMTKGYSAALYSSIKSELIALKQLNKINSFEDVKNVVQNTLTSDIEDVRQYQTYQALLNCTRKELIPLSYLGQEDVKIKRAEWNRKIQELEQNGIN